MSSAEFTEWAEFDRVTAQLRAEEETNQQRPRQHKSDADPEE